jgi:hypothetical protein
VPLYASLGGSCEGLVRRMSPGGWALRGERTLWTGRPAHARITRADAGFALYLAAVLVAMAVFGPLWLRGAPGAIKALAAFAWGAGALQLLAVLAVLLVTEPAKRRRRPGPGQSKSRATGDAAGKARRPAPPALTPNDEHNYWLWR